MFFLKQFYIIWKMMIFWIKNINLKVFIIIICIIIAGIRIIVINRNNQKDLQDNYIQINGTINDIYRSGNGIYTSTLLAVKYNYNGVETIATIRRGGYKENYYRKGDMVIININKNDHNIVK